ncbi:hypothetical protein [Streptomyces malaysiense]|uniref:hypothetical protein n=1 Tax=Streptomyces malaysiense TaxID=1428626 RepID=UPI000A809934|nr:hypothetical protein [Streptomyces malaysiense]
MSQADIERVPQVPAISCLMASPVIKVGNPIRSVFAEFRRICQAGHIEVDADPDG